MFAADADIDGKFEKLYRKYIARDAEFQINISFRDRIAWQRIVESDGRTDVGGVIDVVDQCIVELWLLLRDSYSRFQRTADYREMCRRITPNRMNI